MASRLNIEIIKNNMVLANSYFHDGSYTKTAIILTRTMLENMHKINEEHDVIFAVRMLESVGAGLSGKELKAAEAKFPGHRFEKALGRETGYIAITELGIQKNYNWEETRITIDLSKKTVSFGVYYLYSKKDFIESFGKEKYSECPNMTFVYSFDSIPFDQFNHFAEKIQNLIDNRVYRIKNQNGKILCFIE